MNSRELSSLSHQSCAWLENIFLKTFFGNAFRDKDKSFKISLLLASLITQGTSLIHYYDVFKAQHNINQY